jgi:2-(1,2-epoxy-1,2-dihydrophenyl)acetyl-CoA isomerase
VKWCAATKRNASAWCSAPCPPPSWPTLPRPWATELAALPTVAVGYMKRNLNLGLHASLAEVLDAEAVHMIRTFETDDHKGAAAAFVEKRAPTFNGR